MFTVKKCTFSTTLGEVCGYVIENASVDPVDLMWVNKYLHKLSNKSSKTTYQYAHRLCKFLQFLKKRGKTYRDCTDDDIVKYMHGLQYDMSSAVVFIVEQRLSPQALAAYYYPIRGLYIYLFDCKQPVKVDIQLVMKYRRERYLQGIAPALPSPDLVLDTAYERGAPAKDYIKWYTEEQKEALLSSLRTLRDRAIFSISLDGFRIDEILSSRESDYDQENAVLTPYRSKRKQDGSKKRSAPLSDRSVKLLKEYKINERDVVETEVEESGGKMPDEIFVVLRRGESCGQPLKYGNFMQILKGAARRAGMDETKIRTHSGRSTRANEVVTDRAKNPGKWTDKDIRDLFGWKSDRSAEPYINRNDPERMKALAGRLRDMDKKRRQTNDRSDKKL